MEKIARCSVFLNPGLAKISGSAYMPHAATDNISGSLMLASGASGFVLSFSNLFDQCRVTGRCRMCGKGAIAQGLTKMGN